MKALCCRIVKADKPPLKEVAPQNIKSQQNYPGSIKNDPFLKDLVVE